RTGPDGLAFLPHGDRSLAFRMLLARKDGEVAFLPEETWGTRTRWGAGREARQFRWCVFDDRGLNRPGEEAAIQGWLRVGAPEGGPADLPTGLVREVSFRIEKDF